MRCPYCKAEMAARVLINHEPACRAEKLLVPGRRFKTLICARTGPNQTTQVEREVILLRPSNPPSKEAWIVLNPETGKEMRRHIRAFRDYMADATHFGWKNRARLPRSQRQSETV